MNEVLKEEYSTIFNNIQQQQQKDERREGFEPQATVLTNVTYKRLHGTLLKTSSAASPTLLSVICSTADAGPTTNKYQGKAYAFGRRRQKQNNSQHD
jgi:hypothetical protein